MFLLELRHVPSGELVANRSVTSKPYFKVEGLPPQTRFKLVLYSSNDKGLSEPVILQAVTGKNQNHDQDVKYSYSAGKLYSRISFYQKKINF